VPTPPLPLIGITPCRIADTRGNGFTGQYGAPALAAGSPRSFVLTGQCGIPSTAQAVSLNVTVTNTLGPGFVKIFPEGAVSPVVSTVNFTAGETIANAAIVPLGTGGGVTVGAAAGTDLILDTNGYYDANGLITRVSAGTGLTGGGSAGDVTLGIAAGGVTSNELASNAVTSPKIAANSVTAGAIAAGQVVKSVNGLFDGVTLAAGSNVTISKAGQTLTFSSSGGASGWELSGNSGLGCTTSPCASFLGTTDSNDALEVHIGGARALRVEPTDSVDAPNFVAGWNASAALPGVKGAAIGGGGFTGEPNLVTDDDGTIGGGSNNQAGDNAGTTSDAPFATVGGGRGNKASWIYATVGGGQGNTASDGSSTVGGGFGNTASSGSAVVSGGVGNVASGYRSTVSGGAVNVAGGQYATVAGGYNNGAYGAGSLAAGRLAQANADGVFIWGDGTSSFISTTTPNQFLVQATGGFGINTTAPSAALDVAGVIRSSAGGFKFPDNSTQTTAGLASVSHDATLAGNGTAGSALGVAAAGVGPPQLSAAGSSNGQVLTSSGSAVSWQSPSGLTSVVHDTTLSGNGTAGTPLGVAAPLGLSSSNVNPTITGVNSFGAGVAGTGTSSATGVQGTAATGYGVYGVSNGIGPTSQGVRGFSSSGTGVVGASDNNNAIVGTSGGGAGSLVAVQAGVWGDSNGHGGVVGSSNSGDGIYGYSVTGQAGHFVGNVQVTGTLSKGGGSFKIDDPIDPENKYLYHSFVESPDMMNIYNGNVVLDGTGEAVVELPEWFGALNRDFRYQLTCIGDVTPVYVKEEVQNNRFTIAGLKPGDKVSWQITGIRKDPFANGHRIPVEEEKPEAEKGRYLHPREYGQPEEKGVESVRISKP
jgi:hypothetical protein